MTLDNAVFYNSFSFNKMTFNRTHYSDFRSGALKNYVAFMLKGQARIVTENEKLEIREGSLFFIPKGLPYQSYWFGEEEVSWYSYGFDLIPDGETRIFSLQELPVNEQEMYFIREMAAGKSPRTIGLLYELLDLLMPVMKSESGKHLQATMEKLLKKDLRIPTEDIAKSLGISVSGFYSQFRQESGMTPNHFRRLYTVRLARELLTTTDLPVEEISRQLFFSSSSYFRKILYEVTGKTPSQIRKEAIL